MNKAIGIDLGTTNSVVAFKDTSVRILRNKEEEELTRSCVASWKGEVLVGRPAYQLLERDPENTILSVKRLMGGSIEDSMVQQMRASDYYKYAITELQGGTKDAVAVVMGGKQWKPEQISAEILKKLKADAEEKLGSEVTHAVITVPAYFSEKQKNATKIAAQLAGLKVQKLLAEPTAAAIAYGVDNLKAGEATNVLIYDFGGGTFDLSILTIADGNYLESGTGGDRWLGGDNLDQELQKIVLKKVADQYGIQDLKSLVGNLPVKKRNQFEGEMRYRTMEAKILLNNTQSASIIIDNILEDEEGEAIDIDITITREEFEKAIRPLVQRSIDLIEELLNEVSYDIEMIDYILLVGGSAKIPLVRKMLIDCYGSARIKSTERPMLTVAEGAAILAHRLDDDYEVPDETVEGVIKDVVYTANHNYYVEYLNGDNREYERIVEKQEPLRYSASRHFKTTTANQKILTVRIFQDAEGGKKEKQTSGFTLIQEALPIGSELTFDFTLGIDETFELSVYPKGKKSKAGKVILGRGNADQNAIETIDALIERAVREYKTVDGEEELVNYLSTQIGEINGMKEVPDKKWHEIYYKATEKFEEIMGNETATSQADHWMYRAVRLDNEFGDLLNPADREAMRQIVTSIKTGGGNEEELTDRLKRIVKSYQLHDMTLEIPGRAGRIEEIPSTVPGNSNRIADIAALRDNYSKIVSLIRNQCIEEATGLLASSFEIIHHYDYAF